MSLNLYLVIWVPFLRTMVPPSPTFENLDALLNIMVTVEIQSANKLSFEITTNASRDCVKH